MFKLASNPCISPDSVGVVVAGESNSIRFADINGEILDYPLASWCSRSWPTSRGRRPLTITYIAAWLRCGCCRMSWTTSIDESGAILQPLWSPPPPPRFAACLLMYNMIMINYLNE